MSEQKIENTEEETSEKTTKALSVPSTPQESSTPLAPTSPVPTTSLAAVTPPPAPELAATTPPEQDRKRKRGDEVEEDAETAVSTKSLKTAQSSSSFEEIPPFDETAVDVDYVNDPNYLQDWQSEYEEQNRGKEASSVASYVEWLEKTEEVDDEEEGVDPEDVDDEIIED